jgi:hypothetical protein
MIDQQFDGFASEGAFGLMCVGLLSHAQRCRDFIERQCDAQVADKREISSKDAKDEREARDTADRDEAVLFVLGLLRVSQLVVDHAEQSAPAPREVARPAPRAHIPHLLR